MKPAVIAAFVISTVLFAACTRHDGTGELPPAVGSGVASPEVPSVRELMTDVSAAATPGGPTALAGTGTLYANEEAQLGPKMSGTLTAVLVDEGDKVKKGQVVFRLDAAQADLSVRQARAQLESAQVGLRAAELDYNRTKELHQSGSVADATFDQLQARYDTAKNAVSQAQVALGMAQRALSDTVVRSPINGVVSAKLKSVGETVTMMPPTTVLLVQDVHILELRARLPERALATLTTGSTLTVSLPALGVERKVSIKRINPAIDVATRTAELIADLDNADGKLKPGMLADIQLESAAVPEAKAAPSTAPKADTPPKAGAAAGASRSGAALGASGGKLQ